MNVRDQVLAKLRAAWPKLTSGEQAVAEVLATMHKPITQNEIARTRQFLGSHPRFENYPNRDTTLRRVRQLIRNLKVDHLIAILANTKGYWLPNTIEECEDYLDTMARQAKAAARSYMETVDAMHSSIDGLRERPPTNTLFDLDGEPDE